MGPNDTLTLHMHSHGNASLNAGVGNVLLGQGDEYMRLGDNLYGNWLASELQAFGGRCIATFLDACHTGGFWGNQNALGIDERGKADLDSVPNLALYAAAQAVLGSGRAGAGHYSGCNIVGKACNRMKVTVIGSGYVGLVTGACLSEMGNHVVCLDVDARKVAMLQAGQLPLHEPGLADLVARNAAAGRLSFTTDVPAAVAHGTLQFIGVGTPPDEDGSADLQYVLAAARSIGRHMTDYKVVVDKSTVPVGTADKVRAAVAAELQARGMGSLAFAVVSNPEFLKEGAAIADFMRPDRIVVGADDERAVLLMRALYAPYIRNHDRLMVMDLRSAEFTKYAANAMLATRISFMNELSELADKVGADIEAVRRGIGSDPRIGTHFLYAGTGYGGSCFPKDVQALIQTGRQNGVDLQVLNAVEAANERQKHVLVRKLVQRFGADLSGRVFAMWGLAFKPNTDDMREAPSRVIVQELAARGAVVQAYDPVAMPEAQRVLGDVPALRLVASPALALQGADALLIVTEWKEFKSPDFDGIKQGLKQPLVFDGRNLYEPALMQSLGIEYHAIGRGAALGAPG